MARDLKSKLKMPAKPMADRAAEEEVDMDIADLDLLAAEPEADIMAEEEDLDMAELEEPGLLQDISDDELLAEAVARGLMPEPELEDAEDDMVEEEA
jgi:hypothetical protein